MTVPTGFITICLITQSCLMADGIPSQYLKTRAQFNFFNNSQVKK